MNTLQRIPGPARCDLVLDADGMVTHRWRAATPAEIAEWERSSAAGEGDPNHPMYANKIFGYDEKSFLARQYKTKAPA